MGIFFSSQGGKTCILLRLSFIEENNKYFCSLSKHLANIYEKSFALKTELFLTIGPYPNTDKLLKPMFQFLKLKLNESLLVSHILYNYKTTFLSKKKNLVFQELPY